MKYSVCRILCIALLSTTLFDFSSGFFPNTLNGFLQDIQNPSSLLALLMLKYWLLVSSGAITFTGAAIGKRSVPSTAPPFSTDDFYAMVLSKVDNEQCIPRLICLTLGSRRDAKAQAGSNFERKILQTFGEKPLPDSLSYPKSPGFIYKYAAYIGRYASTPEACKQLFPKCKQNMTELQKMANLIFDSRL